MKKMYQTLLFFCLIMTGSLFAQNKRITEIDSCLRKLEINSKFIGYVIISHGDSILYQRGLGYSDIENKIPFSKNTLICICSTGKIFTATTIMKMIQDNKIKLDDKIGQYFPELPFGDNVSIKHLLTHTSGLGDYQENPAYFKNKSCTDNIAFLRTQKLKFKPGDKTYYSTSGMILLGALIEKVYGKNYIDVIKEGIIVPNKMDNTLFINYKDALNQKEKSIALPYKINDDGRIFKRTLSKADTVLIPLAAGGQFSCAGDIFKFDRALYSYKILNKEHIEKMIEKQSKSEWPDTYFSLGFVIENAGSSIEGAGHGGCDNTYYNHFIKQDITLIITSIEGYANTKYSKDAFEVAEEIKKILFEQ